MCWEYRKKNFSNPGNYHGFIYRITNDRGKMYIGKKSFEHRRKVNLSKKQRLLTGKRVKINIVDSKWKDYWGSNKELLQWIDYRGTNGFKREILKLCKDKASLSYWEVHYLVLEGVLFSDYYYNGNISGKWFKGKIHE